MLASCSTPSPTADDDSPYSAEIRNAQKNASSDFERQVLEDGVIEASEYKEAVDRFVECIHDLDVPVTLVAQGNYFIYETPQGDAFASAQDECSVGTNGQIEPLYAMMDSNPEKRDPRTIRAECLVRAKVAPKEYSAADFDSDTAGITTIVDITSPEYQTCMNDPTEY